MGRSPTREGGRVAGTMDSRKTVRRQSGIELLRIIAMYLIVTHHMVNHNSFDFLGQPGSFRQVVLSLFQFVPGKIGIALFFIASAWFLSTGTANLKNACRKIWVLECEILFWSIAGLVFQLLINPEVVHFQQVIMAFFPTITQLWWYTTCYALFLIFLAIHQPKFAAYRAERAQEACRRYGRCLGSVVGNSIFIDGYRFEPYRLHVCLYVNYILSVVYAASVNQIRCRRCSYLRYIVAGVEYSFWIIVYR